MIAEGQKGVAKRIAQLPRIATGVSTVLSCGIGRDSAARFGRMRCSKQTIAQGAQTHRDPVDQEVGEAHISSSMKYAFASKSVE